MTRETNSTAAPAVETPKPLKLPDDIPTLARMRDQLSDYLSLLERNTDTVELWLAQNGDAVTVLHHQLIRTIRKHKDADLAEKLLKETDEKIVSFVLSVSDFAAITSQAFGADNKVGNIIASLPKGIHPSLLKELPVIDMGEEPQPPEEVKEEPKAKPEEKGFLSGLFGAASEKQRLKLEEEAKKREQENIRRRAEIKNDLIGLQSERHYYIDDTMNWISEVLVPQNPGQDPYYLLHQHQHPAHVIARAQQDFDRVISERANTIRQRAADYGTRAGLLDDQNIDGFIPLLDDLFPKNETTESLRIKKMLLADFGAESFVDIAINHVTDRKAQARLFDKALSLEKKISFSNTSGTGIFTRILNEVADESNPLDLSILRASIPHIFSGREYLQYYMEQEKINPFALLCKKFENQPERWIAPVKIICDAVGIDPSLVDEVERLYTARCDGSAAKLSSCLTHLAAKNPENFIGLWYLCHPEMTLHDAITGTIKDPVARAEQLRKAIGCGLLGELAPQGADDAEGFANFIRFFEENALDHIDNFPLETAKALLVLGQCNKYRDTLREKLSGSQSWLEKIIESTLQPEQKLQWIAAVMSPFADDIFAQANIFNTAAQNAASSKAEAILSLMDKNTIGKVIPLAYHQTPKGIVPLSIADNLDRFANIWYDQSEKELRYIVDGNSARLRGNVDKDAAYDMLSVIKRRGGFRSEYGGIYHLDNILRIETNRNGVDISWKSAVDRGSLNLPASDLPTLHQQKGFIHFDDATSGTKTSYRIDDVAFIAPDPSGGHLVINQHGKAEIIKGSLSSPMKSFGGVYFNPSAAGMIYLDPKRQSLEFRIQSTEFAQHVRKNFPGEDFHYVALADAKAVKTLQAELAENPKIIDAGGGLYMNIEALRFLKQEADTGFLCAPRGKMKSVKPSKVEMEKSYIDNISHAVRANRQLLTVGDFTVHPDSVDDVYYDKARELLYVTIGQNLVQVNASNKDAALFMQKLSEKPGFMSIRDAKGEVRDVFNFGKTVVMDLTDQTTVTVSTGSFPITVKIPELEAQKFFAAHIKAGMEDAAESAKKAGCAWVVDLQPRISANKMPNYVPQIPQRGAASEADALTLALKDKKRSSMSDNDEGNNSLSAEFNNYSEKIQKKPKLSVPKPTF